VLDDGVLFVVDGALGHCYYSLNNGGTWHWSGQYIHQLRPVVRKAGDFIYVTEPYWADISARINLTTHQTEVVQMSDLPGQWSIAEGSILEDGTIVMFGIDVGSTNAEFLVLQYRFGGEIEAVSTFPLINFTELYASGTSYYAFGQNSGQVFTGTEFQSLTYTGLPAVGRKWFFLSQNEHVYVIVDETPFSDPSMR
jgi:hypothetical protein